MVGERMAKRSIGSLMRKKLSDITNSQLQGQPKLPTQEEKPLDDTSLTDKDCIQQLLKERVTLMQLLAEKNKMIEWSGAELQMLRANIQKLQLQNWNLAQSNSHMLAELNLGRERIKALQHEILWRAALLKGKNAEVVGKVEMNYENNVSLSHPQEGDEKARQPSPKASIHNQRNMNRRRCIRRRSTGSSTDSTKNGRKEKAEDKRPCLRRRSTRFETDEREPLENLFELEDLVIQSRPDLLSCRAVKNETGESSALRNKAPRQRSSFGIPSRKSVDKAQSHKDISSSKSQSAKARAGRIN